MEQERNRLTKRMLPFLMKPYTLIIITVTCILGETMWMARAIQDGNKWEALGLFIIGLLMGFISGNWTSKLFDEYYVQTLLKRVNVLKTPMGRRNTIFTVLALGVPMAASFVPAYQDPFLPILQSYIFGFICGTNVVIYLWARKLPG